MRDIDQILDPTVSDAATQASRVPDFDGIATRKDLRALTPEEVVAHPDAR